MTNMSWLTDLAGKAENFLNKIDQNAAVVLKDKNLINEQLTDVIWNTTSLKTFTSVEQDEGLKEQPQPSSHHTSLFSRFTRSSPSGAPSPTFRSSPRSDGLYSKRNDEDDILQLLNHAENITPGLEDARGSPLGASIPSSPVPSCSHSRTHSQGGVSSVSSSSTSLVRDDPSLQHCFKPVEDISASHVPVSDLMAENSMLKNEVRCLNSELTLLHQRCKAAKKEADIAEMELQTLRAVQSENENLKTELCSLESQQLPLNSIVSDNKREFMAMLEKKEHLQSENESLREEIKELRCHFLRLQTALSEAAHQNERHRQQLQDVTQEAEQYRARASRVLQDKERLIASLQEGDQCRGDSSTFVLEQEVEQLREEIRLLRVETTSQAELLRIARQDLQELEVQKEQSRQNLDAEIERLQNRLQDEWSRRMTVEEDYRNQTEELRKIQSDFSNQFGSIEKRLKEAQAELASYQAQASHSSNLSDHHSSTHELEGRVRHLATALMQKQGALEALIAERNALQLHIEQNERKSKLSVHSSNDGAGGNPNENALRSRAPVLVTENPTVNEATRHVTRSYSGLDRLGLRVGVFFRRYPLARIFVICYMVILHFWVAFVLFTYSPESHSFLQTPESSPDVIPKEPNSLQ